MELREPSWCEMDDIMESSGSKFGVPSCLSVHYVVYQHGLSVAQGSSKNCLGTHFQYQTSSTQPDRLPADPDPQARSTGFTNSTPNPQYHRRPIFVASGML